MSKSKVSKSESLTIEGTGKYPLVKLSDITIVDRPAGEEGSIGRLFYNPRSQYAFNTENLVELIHSIRVDGLQQAPIVRTIEDGGNIARIELIAGERRIRSCLHICEHDLPVYAEGLNRPEVYKVGDVVLHRSRFATVAKVDGEFLTLDYHECHIGKRERTECNDSEVRPTTSGRGFYSKLACRVLRGCTDERALRVAFTENSESEPLTISEEIALVERLEKMGRRQEEIAEMLSTNITWVSQTSSFKSQLPSGAFEKLVKGEMSRNVAAKFLSLHKEDRQQIFETAVKVEAAESSAKIQEITQTVEMEEDAELLHRADAKAAKEEGNFNEAKKEEKKAIQAKKRAEKAASQLERAKTDQGHIKQGHFAKAAVQSQVQPKRQNKALEREEIEELYKNGMMEFISKNVKDPKTGNVIPRDYASILRRTVVAILDGERDPLEIIRSYMYDNNLWDEPSEDLSEQKPVHGIVIRETHMSHIEEEATV